MLNWARVKLENFFSPRDKMNAGAGKAFGKIFSKLGTCILEASPRKKALVALALTVTALIVGSIIVFLVYKLGHHSTLNHWLDKTYGKAVHWLNKGAAGRNQLTNKAVIGITFLIATGVGTTLGVSIFGYRRYVKKKKEAIPAQASLPSSNETPHEVPKVSDSYQKENEEDTHQKTKGDPPKKEIKSPILTPSSTQKELHKEIKTSSPPSFNDVPPLTNVEVIVDGYPTQMNDFLDSLIGMY